MAPVRSVPIMCLAAASSADCMPSAGGSAVSVAQLQCLRLILDSPRRPPAESRHRDVTDGSDMGARADIVHSQSAES
jgi:hypothetical protein